MEKLPDEESAIQEKEPLLYPAMGESPQLRWAFIRKIYIIVITQILLAIVVASIAFFLEPVTAFFNTAPGLLLNIFCFVFAFIVLCPLWHYRRRHPVNLILLGPFTLSISFAVGLNCVITSGQVILEALIVTAAIFISLTIYTFWAATKGYDFGLRPFLCSSLTALIVFSIFQVFFPLGKMTTIIYGGVAALLVCLYIVADTNDLIWRYSYDEYIWASAAIYLDIYYLFINLLSLFKSCSR